MAAVLAVAGATLSCNFLHRAKAAPTPPPLVIPAAAATPTAAPPELPPPPALPPSETSQPPVTAATQLPAPPAPPKPAKPTARRRQNPTPAPSAVQSPQQPPAVPPPVLQPTPELGEVLSPEQQQEYNRLIDFRISRAQRNLELLRGRSLSREQQAALTRIQTFIRQTLQARKDDLITARSLAERADVLAQDLENSSR